MAHAGAAGSAVGTGHANAAGDRRTGTGLFGLRTFHIAGISDGGLFFRIGRV